MDVFFYEIFAEEEYQLKKFLPVNITAGFTDKTIQESGHTAPPTTCISTRTQSKIPTQWQKEIKGVFSRSKGFDHLSELSNTEIVLGSLEDYCSRAVAEQAFLLMLALLRKLPRQIEQMETFHRENLTGREAFRKKTAVLGLGSIGGDIVRLCRAFDMEVRGVDIDVSKKMCPTVSLHEALSWAEIIFVALPLTDQTRGLLNEAALLQVTRGAVLINIARGEITPWKDLMSLLEKNHLGGLGLDVYEEEHHLAMGLRGGEKNKETEAFLKIRQDPRVICTPHNAFNTEEALERKANFTVKAIEYYLKTGRFN